MRLVLDARTTAFAALFDHASLGGSTAQSTMNAVESYQRIRSGPDAWTIGRFECQASSLTELGAAATARLTTGEPPWELLVDFDLPLGQAAALAIDFQAEMDPAISISAARTAPAVVSADGVKHALESILSIIPEIVPLIVLDESQSLENQMVLVAEALSSRRRVGGVDLATENSNTGVPLPTERVAEFIVTATELAMPFRFAAGLMPPVRCEPATGGHADHGVLNLLVASALAWGGADKATVAGALAETNAEVFSVSALSASWSGTTASQSTLRGVRLGGLISIGTPEPQASVAGLADLGFLGEGS